MTTPRLSRALERLVATRNGVWLVCLVYFAAYVPFIGLTRMLSDDLFGFGTKLRGGEVLPLATMASVAVMLAFVAASGWWRFANQRRFGRLTLPFPTRWTALSGLCTAVILTTATMAYAIGVPIVFVMLLMRGGTLIIAPFVDRITGRRVHMSSWLALGLSAAAVSVSGGFSSEWNLTATLCVSGYLLAYFVRLQFMSRLAKSDDTARTKRYFVEEQLVAAPATLVLLGVAAFISAGAGPAVNDGVGFFSQVERGFTAFWETGPVIAALAVGFFSQLVGIFGTLIFLNPRENSFATALNRASSTASGVVAAIALSLVFGVKAPAATELVGAGLVLLAIVVLSQRHRIDRPRIERDQAANR
jgi:hypothetical protein